MNLKIIIIFPVGLVYDFSDQLASKTTEKSIFLSFMLPRNLTSSFGLQLIVI